MRFGIAIAARMPMIAITIRSSMRVKPLCLLIVLTKRSRLLGTFSR